MSEFQRGERVEVTEDEYFGRRNIRTARKGDQGTVMWPDGGYYYNWDKDFVTVKLDGKKRCRRFHKSILQTVGELNKSSRKDGELSCQS